MQKLCLASLMLIVLACNSVSLADPIEDWPDHPIAYSVDIADGESQTINHDIYEYADVRLGQGSQFDIVSGGIVGEIGAYYDSSRVVVDGGSVPGGLTLGRGASASLIDGRVRSYHAGGTSSAIMLGGEVRDVLAFDNATISISGGNVSMFIVAAMDSVIYLDGSGFTVTDSFGNVTLLGYGDRLSDFGSFVENGEQDYYGGIISGTLANGDLLATDFRVIADTGSFGGSGDIVIVPEPASISLVLAGFGLLSGRKYREI